MDKLKVSIITVCYNSVETIEQTIQSVVNQSYKNIEYIIIDGGSTDGTLDLIRKYADKIAYWVSEPDDGIFDAMNKGIRAATGEIIGIINSDDWYGLNTVRNAVNYFMEHRKAQVVHGDTQIVNRDGSLFYLNRGNVGLREFIYRMPSHPSFFVKKQMYYQYGYFDCQYKMAADYDFLMRLYHHQIISHYVPGILAYFRRGGASSISPRQVLRETERILIQYICYYREDVAQKIKTSFCERRYKELIIPYIRRRIARRKDFLAKYFQEHTNYVLFGAGCIGSLCYEFLRSQTNVHFWVIDNNPSLWGRSFYDVKVYPIDVLKDIKGAVKIIIAVGDKYCKEIEKQLYENGFRYKDNYIFFREFDESIRNDYMLQYVRKFFRGIQ